MAKKSNNNFSSPVLYIILGILLAIFRGGALNWAMTIAGIAFVVMGILDIVRGRLANGIGNIVIGAVIILLGNLVLGIVLLVLGIMIAVKGVSELIKVMKKSKKGILEIVFPVITIIVGIGLAFGNMLGDLILIIGILLIVDGVLGLLGMKK